MIPCDWIGIVTIRSETRLIRSISGMITIRPGPNALSPTRPSRNFTARSLLEDVDRGRRHPHQRDDRDHGDHYQDDGRVVSFPPATPTLLEGALREPAGRGRG